MTLRARAAARRAAERATATRRAQRIVAPALPGTEVPNETVLKLISSTPARSSAGRMVWYVGRTRPKDRDDPGCARVRLRDETGAVLSRGAPGESFEETRAATREAFEGLELVPEERNRKRSAPEDAPPRAEDLRHTVVHHLVFSARLRAPAEAERAELAAEAAIREVFGAEGHRCLWAMHDAGVPGEPGSVHAHVHFHIVVKAAQEHGGRRLRFGADAVDIRELRERFAGYARDAGLDASATAREDREEVRRGVADGDVVLRPHRSRYRAQARTALARNVPGWALAHEAEMIRRREAAARRRAAGEKPWPEAPPPAVPGEAALVDRILRPRRRARPAAPEGATGRVLARLEGLYENPSEALASWREMRAELEAGGDSGAFADWYLTHRPEAFGDVTMQAWRKGRCVLARDAAFRALLVEAAGEMPAVSRAPLTGPEAEARLAASSRLAAAAASARRVRTRSADVRAIAGSLERVAATLDRDGEGSPSRRLAGRVRDAASATVSRAADPSRPAEPARRPVRPAPDRERG